MMSLMTLAAGNDSEPASFKFQSAGTVSVRFVAHFVTKYSDMLRQACVFVIVIHCCFASVNAKTSTEASVSSTPQATPEIEERFFGLDKIIGAIFKGPHHHHGPGFGGHSHSHNAHHPNQQHPHQGNWDNIQSPHQSHNPSQDFSQQVNFDSFPSQDQGNLNPGNGLWNGQNPNSQAQPGNWQNVQTPQHIPDQGQNFNQQNPSQDQGNLNPGNGLWNGQNSNPQAQPGNWQNVQTPQQVPDQGQNFNQQNPSQNQGNFNSGDGQNPGQNQNPQIQQGDWLNDRGPQQFPSQQDFNQQSNSDRDPSLSQDNNNFGPGANQNINSGIIDNVPSQNGFSQTGFPTMQGQNTGQTGFQNQNPQGNDGNLNPVAILGNPFVVSSTSAPDSIVFPDEWV